MIEYLLAIILISIILVLVYGGINKNNYVNSGRQVNRGGSHNKGGKCSNDVCGI